MSPTTPVPPAADAAAAAASAAQADTPAPAPAPAPAATPASQPKTTADNVQQSSASVFSQDRADPEKPDGAAEKNEATAIGVSRAEAFNKVLYQSGNKGKILLWLLGISVGLTMFAYALDMGITYSIFSTIASSMYGQHSQLAAVNTASQIIRAISKPFIGKLADITSRPTTYVVVLVFYVVGFAVAATSNNFAAYTVGICFTSVGRSGLDLLSDIIVGDLTPLQWRGFFGAALSIPFVVTVPVNGFIAEGFEDNWRWGLGLFAIVVPVLLIPAIVTLYWIQRRGEKFGMVTMADSNRQRTGEGWGAEEPSTFKFWLMLLQQGLIDIDIIGLVILGFAFSLILLPFTLAPSADGGWANGGMIAMIVIGFVLLIAFGLYEKFLSPRPLMTKHIINNRTFVAAVLIYTFNQTASAVRNTYFSSYIYVIKEWSTYEWTIFLGITTMGLSLLGPIVGLVQRFTHRYKSLMVFGASARMLGYGLLIEADGNMVQGTARLVAAQLIFCLGSFNVVGARVGSQASVPHEDMASIISLLTLWSTLGSSIGSAVASAIWTNTMRERMRMEMPGVDEETISTLYGNIRALRTTYSYDDPVRQGAIRAYTYVNGHITVTALCLAAVPLIASFFMPNFYLGRQQNAVTGLGLDGEKVDVPQDREEKLAHVPEDTKQPFYRKWIAAYYKA